MEGFVRNSLPNSFELKDNSNKKTSFVIKEHLQCSNSIGHLLLAMRDGPGLPQESVHASELLDSSRKLKDTDVWLIAMLCDGTKCRRSGR
jgi:hypothetical protein